MTRSMSEDERIRLLVDFNNTKAPMPSNATLSQQVEAQVARTPDAVAIAGDFGSLTYRELNARANQLARRLQDEGLGLGSLIGVCLERGADLIVAILGVFKAGATYVPLDPEYPLARLEFMLADTRAALVVTETSLALDTDVPQLLLDQERAAIATLPDNNLVPDAGPSDLAYLIYTSGSTGTPKGVMIEHKAVVNFVRQLPTQLQITPESRVLQFTSPSFDVSFAEIFGTLLSGATLIVASRKDIAPGEPLETTIVSHRVSVLIISPSLLATMSKDALVGVRTLVVGGEQCPAEIVAQWMPGRLLVNAYGPTETAVGATFHHFSPEAERVVLGKPVANTRAYVVDQDGELAPIGVAGELWIGGNGLARGYWERPELTAEKFVQFNGERVYRSGDLVRWLSTGDLEFLGRIDQQVKLRGLRIELGEIESALVSHPDVTAAVVIVREDTPGDKRLVAYCIPSADLDAADLRKWCQRSLPEYMVPGGFVAIAEFPLTVNGKLDRDALPAPEVQSEDEVAGPRNATEATIAEIWADVLGVEQVGIHDNFFDLGAHSLLAIRVVSRIAKTMGVELSVRELFGSPTVAELASVLTAASQAAAPLVARERPAAVPMSSSQRRLWFLDQLEPNSDEYVVVCGFKINGALDTAALGKAFRGLIERHEVLRTRFVSDEDGEPLQIVEGAWPIDIATVTLSEDPVDGGEECVDPVDDEVDSGPACDQPRPGRSTCVFPWGVRGLIAAESRLPFDLTSGRLMRVTLAESGVDEYVLVIAMHHIVTDGWSMEVLGRELRVLYAAAAAGTRPVLPVLSVQYADFALWQGEWLDGPVLDEQLAYWRQRLAGLQPVELPTDRPRPLVRSSEGDLVRFTVDPEVVDEMRVMAARHGTSLFMVGLSAFMVVLSRWSRQDDVCVGTPIASRNQIEIEDLIGFFVNTLVMRADLSDNPSFGDLLEQVKDIALDAYAHQDLPFERLVAELAPDRHLGRNPLFQVVFAFQNAVGDDWQLPGLTVSPIRIDPVTSKFDFAFFVSEVEDGSLSAEAVYSTELYDRSTVERLTGHFVSVLGSVVTDSVKPVAHIDLNQPKELTQLQAFTKAKVPFADGVALHELVEAEARHTPDALAVRYGDKTITYRELNARANQLARHLGVQPGSLVGVCVDRGVDLIVALLAVLKAGAAYVPLDPDYPVQRLEFMIEDSGIPLVITQRNLLRLPIPAVLLDDPAIASRPTDDLRLPVGPRDLAYVMYTSGSTGTPKGVMVEHRSICRLVDNNWFADVDHDDVIAQASNFSFDAFTFECWAALTSGASIAVLAKDTVLNHVDLKKAISKYGISTIWLTASLFNQHVRDCPDMFASMKTVLYGGEAVDRSAADALVTGPHAPQRLVNGYGPTETTTFAACHIVTATDGLATMPIGRPIANTTLYVMDRHGGLAPMGVPGELWIGGPGVARGYWNRPELTAERFVDRDGERMYRTGDLVRWLPSGDLDFLGRIDQQVKVRGLRIELGEIETTLANHDAVTTAAVVVREDIPGDKRLVAYCVADEVTPAELRTWCQRGLPEYMIPGAFVFVDALPLTPNGKLDHQALPAPDGDRVTDQYVAPRTELEETIAGVWADILGIDRVGIHDDFFALGGHSLLATRVTNRVGLLTGTEVSLKQFFLTPTVAALAAELTQAKTSSARLLPREAGVWQTDLSFAQRRLWFMDQLEPGSSEYVVPCAFRIRGPLAVGALEAAFTGVVARHEVLRTRFVAGPDGEPLQVIDEPWPVQITEIDLRDRPLDAQSVIDIEAVRPFDLTSGRLLRAMLVQTGDQDHVLLVSMHHIVTDGWSVEILGRELRSLYEGGTLAELPVQYADFALWQNGWLSDTVLDQQLGYWRERLAGLEPLELPTDHPRPQLRSSAGGGVQFTVPAEVASGLRDLAARHGTSLFTVGLAALMVVLARHSGREDVGVGTSIAGRNRHEIEDLVGFFVNTLVMRADLSGNPSFAQLVEQVKATALDAYAHQDLPFERLVEEFAPERDLSRNPLFGVEFAINQVFEWTLPGMSVTPIDVTPLTAKFDLSVALTENDSGELRGDAVFATALFDVSTIARFADHFVAVLTAVAADPAQDVSRIDLLTEAERDELADLQGSATLIGRAPIHKAVQAQAANTPDAIAVVCGENTLTYRELNAEANQLARHLRELGARRGSLVAVCLNRGVDMIVALLGVLKSGAAYVPIDPELPQQRKDFVLADTGAELVITQSGLSFPGVRRVLLDEDRAEIEARSDAGMPTHSGPEDLAYVIYTSGSTGTPKGVMIEHRSLAGRIHEMRDRYLLSDRDRVLQFASITFDAAAEQIFPALMSGSSLILRDSENWTPSRIVTLIREEHITVAELTPALWEQVIPHLETGGLGQDFRLLVLGGDQVTPAAVADWFARTSAPIYNTYGPTETTITATAGVILVPVDTVSIGRPIAETEVFVMDRNGNLAPRGVPGELWIGGIGVARGYLNRPELTAEKFVRFNGQPVYRTGDLVRWLPNGDLEFLGRIDRQVKLRGLRIELGEIEAALAAHADVVSATVIVREDTPGDKRLVAYYVADQDVELRSWCQQSLPSYMVPSAFVALDGLPLTPSGKVDRQALPAPTGEPVTDVDYVAPRSEFERAIANLWAEVLGVARVGVHDNFFALGGHSLLATRVVNKIELLTGLTVSLKQFFLAPTVEALGRQVVELFELEAQHDHD